MFYHITSLSYEGRAIEGAKQQLGLANYLAKRSTMVDYFAGDNTMSTAEMYRRIKLLCRMLGLNGYWMHRAVARTVLTSVRNLRACRANRNN